ncbi:hypothetical protein LJK88_20105 [Paenibacillus sp. P26]|nr:hypothetical protein LJK88_20105 [Paenibacillus sp. P26]
MPLKAFSFRYCGLVRSPVSSSRTSMTSWPTKPLFAFRQTDSPYSNAPANTKVPAATADQSPYRGAGASAV